MPDDTENPQGSTVTFNYFVAGNGRRRDRLGMLNRTKRLRIFPTNALRAPDWTAYGEFREDGVAALMAGGMPPMHFFLVGPPDDTNRNRANQLFYKQPAKLKDRYTRIYVTYPVIPGAKLSGQRLLAILRVW